MDKYRIVMKVENNIRIGLHSYTEAEAKARLLKMKAANHRNVSIISEAECFKGE